MTMIRDKLRVMGQTFRGKRTRVSEKKKSYYRQGGFFWGFDMSNAAVQEFFTLLREYGFGQSVADKQSTLFQRPTILQPFLPMKWHTAIMPQKRAGESVPPQCGKGLCGKSG